MRYFEFANDWAGCHEGRDWNVLWPPPAPAVAVYGAGGTVSFHGPLAAIEVAGLSDTCLPPTASTHPELAGQETCGFLSAEVSLPGGTPRAHSDDPGSAAADTTRHHT